MKLVYCWIENHLGLKDQGFNFGSEYNYGHKWIESKKTLEITRTKNKNYIPDYFKTNGQGYENVTAIVGENGAGKSMLINHLIKIFTEKPHYGNSVLIFEKEDDIEAISGEVNIVFNSKPYNSVLTTSKNGIIFYEPQYTFNNDFSAGGHIFNISSSQILRDNIFKHNIENIDIIHKSKEIISSIDFINIVIQDKNKEMTRFLPFELPKYLNFKIYEENGYLEWDLGLNIRGFDKDEDTIPNQNLSQLKKIYDLAKELFQKNSTPFNKLLIYYFKQVCEIINGRIKSTARIKIKTVKPIISEDLKTYIAKQISYLQKQTTIDNKDNFNSNRYLDIFNRFESEFDSTFSFQIELNKKEVIDGDSKLIANQLVHDYIILATDFGIRESLISIYWDGISTGEMAFLTLFSRFYIISDSILILNKFENLYIFIDEGELGFHVNWQKNYLEYLTKGLTAIFLKNKNRSENVPPLKLQLILATHSPIILSDFPSDHVIFLKKECDEKKENCKTKIIENKETRKTFAANIHDILNLDFFMEKGFMGSYVTEKINEVIYFLNCLIFNKDLIINGTTITEEEKVKKYLELKPDKDKTIDFEALKNLKLFEKSREGKEYPYLVKFIANIDEPILKIKLNELYYKAMGGSVEEGRLLAQQKIIEKRLKELK